jgi:anaerobic magnesium-protoporphyrin IX monomethyl ester cyclase
MSDILLINPPIETSFPQPPMGLMSIGAVLENEGYSVIIIDAPACKYSHQNIAEKVLRIKPKIVGITAMTPNMSSAVKAISAIKKEFYLIMGGAHISVFPKETLKAIEAIDIGVIGEGERTIIEVVGILLANSEKSIRNSAKSRELEQVRGIAFRKNSEIVINAPRELISNLDDLPIPAYHLVPVEKYKAHPPHGRKNPAMAILTSRGCPYHCIFCVKHLFGNRVRARSSNKVIDEIKLLLNVYDIKEIMFYDDSFTINKKRVNQIADLLISEKIKIPWSCETRVNLVDDNLLKKMRKSGCYLISYGVESGSQEILDNLKKGITIDQVKKAFKWTHKAGINSAAYLMFGSPGETLKTIKKTQNFVRIIKPDFVQYAICTPFPGNEMYEDALQEGVVEKDDWDNFIYASLKGQKPQMYKNNKTSKIDLQKTVKMSYICFYLNPFYILTRVLRIRSMGDLIVNLKGLKMFLNMIR